MTQGNSEQTRRKRRLVLFSDGTGNSSGKLFKTNVWRMYEAVELGPSASGDATQIAYYDNGVGTQRIRPLAMLVGIFGIGLKANVLRLYRYACRNATSDCEIYCFGFSRGAYTIRLVAAILAQYGLIDYQTEDELDAKSRETLRRFMRRNNPNVASFVGTFGRALRDGFLRAWRASFVSTDHGPIAYRPARVRFVGVWDTVAAYGGPIVEVTRGIDDYLWPLTMTDYRLNPRIEIARHALALDDERDAFQPLLWDEVNWHRRAGKEFPDDPERRKAEIERLKQVWFAGMHADVGGGYPDESLSFVSLVWMMQEASDAGLRLIPDVRKSLEDKSNSLGPIHNSRGGAGAYYRPQPRKIAALLHPDSGMDLEDETLSLRDPVLGELPKPPHGLLMHCRVHESVVARLVDGTDDYAPIVLPPQMAMEPYSRHMTGGNHVVDQAVAERLQSRDDDWYDRQERIWDIVFWRRAVYFLAVAVSALFVSLPAWVHNWPFPESSGERAVVQRFVSWRHDIPTGFAEPWLVALETNWALWSATLLGAIALGRVGTHLERRSRSDSRRLWRERIGGGGYSLPTQGHFSRFRNGPAYQRGLQVLRWRILPALAALTLVLAAVWTLMATITQIRWAIVEPGLCDEFGVPDGPVTFGTWQACQPIATVHRGHRYRISIEVRDEWRDGVSPAGAGGIPADPMGVRPALWGPESERRGERPGIASRAALAIGAPLRRVLDARYLQAGIKLQGYEDTKGEVPRMRVQLLDLRTRDGKVFTDIYTAPSDGKLSLFANDAALPWQDALGLYANNCGTAIVRVIDLDDRKAQDAAPPLAPRIPRRCRKP